MLIALGHRKGVGKDAVGAYLRSEYSFRRFAFADRVRFVTKAAFGFTEEQLTNPLLKDEYDENIRWSPRKAMQKIGGVFRQHISSTFWIDHVRRHIMTALEHEECCVITDLRHKNEAEMVLSLGGYLVKVERPSVVKNDNDNSEIELDGYEKWAATIRNNGDLQDLYVETDHVVEYLNSLP